MIKRKPTFRYGGEYNKHDDCIKRQPGFTQYVIYSS